MSPASAASTRVVGHLKDKCSVTLISEIYVTQMCAIPAPIGRAVRRGPAVRGVILPVR